MPITTDNNQAQIHICVALLVHFSRWSGMEFPPYCSETTRNNLGVSVVRRRAGHLVITYLSSHPLRFTSQSCFSSSLKSSCLLTPFSKYKSKLNVEAAIIQNTYFPWRTTFYLEMPLYGGCQSRGNVRYKLLKKHPSFQNYDRNIFPWTRLRNQCVVILLRNQFKRVDDL